MGRRDMELGLFVIHVTVGTLLAAHGAQKLFGWFGGHGLQAVSGMFDSLGFRPGSVFARISPSTQAVKLA